MAPGPSRGTSSGSARYMGVTRTSDPGVTRTTGPVGRRSNRPASTAPVDQTHDHEDHDRDGDEAEEHSQDHGADDERQVDEPGGDDSAEERLQEPHVCLRSVVGSASASDSDTRRSPMRNTSSTSESASASPVR